MILLTTRETPSVIGLVGKKMYLIYERTCSNHEGVNVSFTMLFPDKGLNKEDMPNKQG